MCKSCSHLSMENGISNGQVLAVHYYPKPNEQIEVLIACTHGEVLPFSAARGSDEFELIYDFMLRERIEADSIE